MEVHAHTHPAPGGTHRKWTHYLWEFIMLFLAVFCGFLAENIREHKVESHRELQYMQLLVEDLKADTAMLAGNIATRQKRLQRIDTFLAILHSPTAIRQRGSELYVLARAISPPVNISRNDGTIEQLKSSGSFRLVHKKEVLKHILTYDQKMRQAIFLISDESGMRETFREQLVRIFDNRVFLEMSRGDTLARPAGNPSLFSYDPALLNELSGDIQYLRRLHRFQTENTGELLRYADSLMIHIRKEYHLE